MVVSGKMDWNFRLQKESSWKPRNLDTLDELTIKLLSWEDVAFGDDIGVLKECAKRYAKKHKPKVPMQIVDDELLVIWRNE